MEVKKVKRRLLPSKRQKKRYIAIEIVTNEKFDVNKMIKYIYDSFHKCIGNEADHKSNFYFLMNKFNNSKKRCMIRTTPKYQKKLVDIINNVIIYNSNIKLITLGVSGSLKKCYNKYITS